MFDLIKGEKGGKPSMMRLMSLLVVCSVMGVFVVHNAVAMFKGAGFVSMGSQEAMLLAGVLSAKAAQVFGEKRTVKNLPVSEMPVDKKE